MEIKECPFCGEEVEVEENGRGLWHIRHFCGVLKGWIETTYVENRKEAETRWNTRRES